MKMTKIKRAISSIVLLSLCMLLMLSLTGAASPISDNEIGISNACACDVKCTEGTMNVDCIACATDIVLCTGKKPETPIEPKYTTSITSPSGWKTKQADVVIHVTDENKTGFSKVECKVERNGSWQDLTDSLTERANTYSAPFEISENCTVYVSVTDKTGKNHTKSRYIECFDRTPPTVRAGVNGKLLRVEADDDLSGVAAVYVCGNRFTGLTNGTVDIRLEDYADEYEQITINATDEAGNKSKTVQLKNPYYKQPKPDKDISSQTSKPTDPPPTEKPKPKPPVVPTSGNTSESAVEKEEKPFTSDGTGRVVDNATDEDGKEFYTITTADENVFYLIIDKQRDDGNVYFLNAVTENDLKALALKKENENSSESAVPDAPVTCSCTEKCEEGKVNTVCRVCIKGMNTCKGTENVPTDTVPTPEQPQKRNAGTTIFIILAVLATGGAGYYFKIYKPKHDVENAEDLDDLFENSEEKSINEDEETVNEDTYFPEDDDFPDDDYPQDYENDIEDGSVLS